MRFLVDQDVYHVTVEWLRKEGHDVVTAKEVGMQRAALRMRIIPTDTLDETEDGGGISQPSSALLQACGPREPHPRQVDILLNNGVAVTCVKYNGRPRTLC